MMNKKEKDILDWANRQVDIIINKFIDKENTSVYFHDFNAMGVGIPFNMPEANEKSKGGILKMIVNSPLIKEIDYTMFKDAVVDIHNHPDYYEIFTMLKGSMVNELTGTVYRAGQTFEMLPYEPHQFRSLEDSHMTIKCIKC